MNKKLVLNWGVLITVGMFLTSGFVLASTMSQPEISVSPAKPLSTTTFPQLIVTAADAKVRAEASTNSAEVHHVKLGTLMKVLEKTSNDWYRIEIPTQPENVRGWISGQVVEDWDADKREAIYLSLIEKNYRSDQMPFLDASELFEFLSKAQTEITNPDLLPHLEFKRLLTLRLALRAIPFDKGQENPYKDFLKENEEKVVYSDPAGEWFVRSELFWDLRKKYSTSAIAEDIAWEAAENPLPGECEGYINCYLFLLRETDARYLDLYPNGKHSLEALKNIQTLLEPIVADLKEKRIYTWPTDVSERVELNRLLSEIRAIVSKIQLSEQEKQKTLQQLDQMAESFK